jgi:NADPH:quinone reductase-like Zn-dependent oxidoreductase
LGGSGGVGTFLVQLARNYALASFIATTSTDEPLLKSLGADHVIDYTQQCWWDIPEFEDDPFDVIFDLGVGKKQAWTAAKNFSILKRKGKFVTLSGDNPELEIHNLGQTIGVLGVLYGRILGSGCWPLIPRYVWHSGLDLQPGTTLKELFQLVQDGKLKVVLDPVSPLPFTTDGIKRGFHLMNARHAHGKVVVQVVV